MRDSSFKPTCKIKVRRKRRSLVWACLFSAPGIVSLPGAIDAQTCSSYAYSLTNGTTADATQVMGNFDTIRNCANTNLAPLADPTFTGKVGIGIAPTQILDISKTTNGPAIAQLQNTSTGTGAFMSFQAWNGTAGAALRLNGSGFTTVGIDRQNGLKIESGGAGGLTLNTGVNQPIYFGVQNVQVGQWNSAGLSIGTSAPATSAKLDVQGTTGALLLPRLTTTQRDALTAANGMIIYNTTTNTIQARAGGAWVNL
jgi:hypothetical protein